jgi:hypothetical protein
MDIVHGERHRPFEPAKRVEESGANSTAVEPSVLRLLYEQGGFERPTLRSGKSREADAVQEICEPRVGKRRLGSRGAALQHVVTASARVLDERLEQRGLAGPGLALEQDRAGKTRRIGKGLRRRGQLALAADDADLPDDLSRERILRFWLGISRAFCPLRPSA